MLGVLGVHSNGSVDANTPDDGTFSRRSGVGYLRFIEALRCVYVVAK